MTYTDVFGNNTLPPAEYGYARFNLTTDSTFVWPYNSSNASFTIAKVMDMTCSAGVSLVLPNATEVSTGEDFMVRNVGSVTLTVKDASGTQVTQVLPGAATYFYLTSNATASGLYGVIAFGVGTSSVDAASLVGYGVKAIGSSLNQSHPVVPTNTGITLGADHRSKLVVFTGGAATFSLTSAAVLGDDYFTMFRNDGTGTATIDPAASEMIDGMAYMQVQPGESLMLICTGTQWYSVGYSRSTLYQFTQLTKDISAGGTITLSATEASNKLITFVGNPAGAVNVVVPGVVAVYYTQSAISTAQTITLKTAGGSGASITQGTRIIALCDGTNVVSAQSAVANASVSLTDGSVAVPSLFFATQTNTGLYKDGIKSLGVTVEGVSVGVFGPNGLQTATLGPNSTQRHTVPAVTSDTVTLNTAAQTLTNKTLTTPTLTLKQSAAPVPTSEGDIQWDTAGDFIVVGNGVGQTSIPSTSSTHTFTNKTLALGSNTVSGTTAQFNTALTDNDFATLAGAETLTNKSINLTSNTLTGTKAQFDTALSDDNFLYVGDTTYVKQTLTTGSAILPSGTTAQRDGTPAAGYLRFNVTLNQFEGYNGTAWGAVGGGDGFRNKIINGAFGINQRGYVSGAATTAGQYTLDRWKVTGTGGITFSTVNNKTTVTIPAGQTLQQVIEGLNLATGDYVLSWGGTAQGRIGAGAYGASGSVKASITGGTDTTIEFNTGTVENVQLAAGSIATPFEHRPYGLELSLCQRYYQDWSGQFTLTSQTNAANINKKTLPVQMRATPTVTQTTSGGIGASWVATTLTVYQSGIHSVDTQTSVLTLSAEL